MGSDRKTQGTLRSLKYYIMALKKKKKSSKVQTWDYRLSLSFEVLYYLLLLHVPSEAK